MIVGANVMHNLKFKALWDVHNIFCVTALLGVLVFTVIVETVATILRVN